MTALLLASLLRLLFFKREKIFLKNSGLKFTEVDLFKQNEKEDVSRNFQTIDFFVWFRLTLSHEV